MRVKPVLYSNWYTRNFALENFADPVMKFLCKKLKDYTTKY